MASLFDQYFSDVKPSGKDSITTTPSEKGGSLFDHYFSDVKSKPTSGKTTELPEVVVAPPISGMSKEDSDRFNAQAAKVPVNQNSRTTSRYSNSIMDTPSNVMSGVVEAPYEYGSSVVKRANESSDLLSSAARDVSSGNVATGVGKGVLGGIGYVASPIMGVADEAGKYLTKMTGKPENQQTTDIKGNPMGPMHDVPSVGERAVELGTSGIPIIKTASTVQHAILPTSNLAKANSLAFKSALPTTRAINEVVDAIGGEGNINRVIADLERNPRLTLADVSEPVKQLTQGLVLNRGPHQQKMFDLTTHRINSAKDVVEGVYNDAMGKPVNLFDKINEMKDAAKEVGTKKIQPALENARGVNINDVIKHIDEKMKPGVTSVISAGEPLPSSKINTRLGEVRDLLANDDLQRISAKDLHNIQSSLRSEADNLLNSTSGEERQRGYALMAVRDKLVDAIDTASPRSNSKPGIGTYRQALSEFRDEKQIEDAFKRGTLITRNKLGVVEDHPSYWEDWVKGASKEEIQAAREGARLAVDQQINGMRRGARRGEDIPEVEFNKEKLSTLFNKETINHMHSLLKDERKIAEVNSDLYKNSQTAQRTINAERTKPREATNIHNTIVGGAVFPIAEAANHLMQGQHGLPTLGMGTMAGFMYGKNKLNNVIDRKTNSVLADLAFSTGADRDELIKILKNYQTNGSQSSAAKATNLLSNVVRP